MTEQRDGATFGDAENDNRNQSNEKRKSKAPSDDDDDDDDDLFTLDCKKFTFLILFLMFGFPIIPMLIALVFGGLFAALEPDTTFRQGFLYVTSNLLGFANPLTDYDPSGRTIAIILDMYVAITALVVFGIMLNIVDLFEVPEAINGFLGRFIKNKMLVTVFALVILIPLWNAAMCCIFGLILAAAEDWTIEEGILYVFTNALGLGTALTDVVPETVGGALLDIVVSGMALGYLAVFADYVVTLDPSRYVRRKFRTCLAKGGVLELNEHNLADAYTFDDGDQQQLKQQQKQKPVLPPPPSNDGDEEDGPAAKPASSAKRKTKSTKPKSERGTKEKKGGSSGSGSNAPSSSSSLKKKPGSSRSAAAAK
mmetsp:Transcript_20226/g.47529  ORF Transcript_20226/g.47529 Transcript_20226/m.47529 type:complete len:367 (-) Transcript_20226:183-1283(-)